MNIKQFTKAHESLSPITMAVSAAILLQMSFSSHAQEFADDFSTNTIRYSTGSFGGSGGENSTTALQDGIRLSANSDGAAESVRFLSVGDSPDTFELTGRFDTDSLQLSDGAMAQISAQGVIFNDTFDNAAESDSGEGDVFISVNSTVFSDDLTNLFVCLTRSTADGIEDYRLFENGTNNCRDYSQATLLPGDDLRLGFSLDRDAKTLAVIANDVTDVFDIQTEIFPSRDTWRAAVLTQYQAQGSASFDVSSIADENGTDDFAVSSPVVDRYSLSYRTLPEKPFWRDGRVMVEYTGSEDTGVGRIDLVNPTDYLESTFEISSSSDIGNANASVGARLDMNLYNDLADGGVDGYTGNVHGSIDLSMRNDGLRRAEYCLYRIDDAEANERTGLLSDDGSTCISFPIQIAFDEKYRTAIELDRESSVIVFRVNGHVVTVPVNTPVFTQFLPFANLWIGAGSGSSVLGYIDDVRTAATLPTTGELASGVFSAPVFPDAPEEIVVDSTLDLPYDFNQELEFIDDFNNDTVLLGVEQYPASTDSGINYTDGALELQTHSNRDPEDGSANTNFLITQPTDSIRVVAALSSLSELPPGDRNEASLELNAVFHNDTADGGAGERTGDITAELRIRLDGTGRRIFEAEVRRRDSSGDNNRLDIFPDGEDGYRFDGLVPELDRPYDLRIRLDRENVAMVFSVDAMEIAVPLNTELFVPAQRRIDINSSHRAGSGRSVVRIYAIETDSDLLDFSTNPPALAPYRPTFSDRFPGRETTVSNGRLRFFADGNITSGRDPSVRVNGSTDFVGATLELSSESIIAADGEVFVGVSGTMYNDIGDDLEGSEGNVFAAIRLTATDNERFVEYCAFRSNTPDFSDSIELIGGQEGSCPRFVTQPDFDVAYPASIFLNAEEATLTFQFANEIKTYNITTGIFSADESFTGVRARTSDGSVVVAYADDLAFSADPTPLADSSANLSSLTFERPEVQDEGATDVVSEPADNTSQLIQQHPVCAAVTSDTDGDGWGWEDGMSCVVEGSNVQQQLMQSLPPLCTAMAVTIDSQGWGWENNATCIEAGSYAESVLQR